MLHKSSPSRTSETEEERARERKRQEERKSEREATIFYSRNACGAYCFLESFHRVAIDPLYVFPVLLSVFSITSPSDPTTKDTASVFNHAGPTPKDKKEKEREREREGE